MKNKILFIVLALIMAGYSSIAQNKETRTVGSFTKIAFRTHGKFYLKQGSPQKVELEGTTDVLSKINTEVNDGKLVIETDRKWNNRNWRHDDEIKVYVTVPSIEAISVAGSGDLIAQTKLTNDGDFKVTVSGSGSMEAQIEATGALEANVSGSGNLTLSGKFKSVESDVSGSGNIAFESITTGDASFGLSGSGNVTARGTARNVKAHITGSGEVKAANLEADACDVRISGSGEVEINVKSSLDANISGSGSVSYRGNPSHVNSHSSGSGSVRKM